MERMKGDKITRTLKLYTKLMNGHLIRKTEEAERSKGISTISEVF